MKLYTEAEAPLLRAIGKLNYTNPFTPERLELEEIILGRPPAPERRVWNMHDGLRGTREDVDREVRKMVDALYHQGGYILSSCNHIQNDIPAEKIRQMFESAKKYSTR